MPFKKDTLRKTGRVFILAAMAGFLMVASNGLTAESGRINGKIRTITPMTEVGSHRANLGAGDYFDVIGILNAVEGNRVTIGDRELTLAPGVRTARAKQYDTVGAKLNRSGQIVVFDLISNDPN